MTPQEIATHKAVNTILNAKRERTIGFICGQHKRVASMLSVKYSTDVCCVLNVQTNEYRLFAHCTPQLCKRMQDYLDGFKDFTS